MILTTSLSWYHRDTKSDLYHAPRDVSDNSDVLRGSAVTTRPNSDSQRHARSDSVRNRVPKEHAHPKYDSLDRARVKLRFTRSRASEISFRDTSACFETAQRVRTHLRARVLIRGNSLIPRIESSSLGYKQSIQATSFIRGSSHKLPRHSLLKPLVSHSIGSATSIIP